MEKKGQWDGGCGCGESEGMTTTGALSILSVVEESKSIFVSLGFDCATHTLMHSPVNFSRYSTDIVTW